MRTLAIECATEACSVALFEHGSLLAGELRVLGRGHAEALVPMIAALPGKGEAGRIAVSLGPGSFTGLRVGLAAARALAMAWQAELLGYPTLALVAAMARAQHGAQPISAVMNGGHGQWFLQEFDSHGSSLSAASSLSPAAAAAAAQADLVAGSQAEALIALRGAGVALALLPDARELLAMGTAELTPDVELRYGRPPDARLPGAV